MKRPATVRFQLLRGRDVRPSLPSFHEHYLDLVGKRERGELSGKSRFPEIDAELLAECVADEEARFGRKLTVAETEALLWDTEDEDEA